MLKMAWALAISGTLMATPASAFDDVQPSAQNTEEVSQARRIVCRRLPPPSGTRIGLRNVCKTQAEWDAEQAQYRQEVQRQQDLSHMGSPSG